MITDIYTGASCDKDSNPEGYAEFNGAVYFAAESHYYGNELWKRAADGTVSMIDINPGIYSSSPTNMVAMGDALFFLAYGPSGFGLYKTDGSEAGTVLLNTFTSGGGLVASNNHIFFIATTAEYGTEPWVSDGTVAGTHVLADLASGTDSSYPGEFVAVAGGVIFSASGWYSLYKSDGTTLGTVPVFNDFYDICFLVKGVNVNGVIYGYAYWGNYCVVKIDPASAGPVILKSSGGLYWDVQYAEMVNCNGTVFFNEPQGTKLWKTDGTAEGTVVVKDFQKYYPGDNPPHGFCAYNNMLLFTGIDENGRELWKSDGTPEGTQMVLEMEPGGTDGVLGLAPVVHNNKAYFCQSSWHRLLETDGTSTGTATVANIPWETSIGSFTSTSQGLVFSVDDGDDLGSEPWISDGTAAGTHILADINQWPWGSNPRDFISAGSNTFFTAQDNSKSFNLYITNAGRTGTRLVMRNCSAGAGSRVVLGNQLIFAAWDSITGMELWSCDLKGHNLAQIKDINTGSYDSSPSQLTKLGNKVYFCAQDGYASPYAMWQTDGTEAGTMKCRDWQANYVNYPENITAIGSTLYFGADHPTLGHELYKSDGTLFGAEIIKDTNSGANGAGFSSFTSYNGAIYFCREQRTGFSSENAEIWKTDGTVSGTSLVKSYAITNYGTGLFPYFRRFTIANNLLFFSGENKKVYRTNGTDPGTIELATFNNLDSMAALNNTVYIRAYSGSPDDWSGRLDLWKSDGSVAGTVLLKDLNTGQRSPGTSATCGFVVKDGYLYFDSRDAMHGLELWRSDGTASGTQFYADLLPGAADSELANLAVCGSRLFLGASSTTTSGIEPFADPMLRPSASIKRHIPAGDSALMDFTGADVQTDFSSNSLEDDLTADLYYFAPPGLDVAALAKHWELYGLGGSSFNAVLYFTFTNEELAASGLDRSRLKLYYSNDCGGHWYGVPSTVDPVNNIIHTTGPQSHFSIWAIGDAGAQTAVPARVWQKY